MRPRRLYFTPKERSTRLFDQLYSAMPFTESDTDYDAAKNCAIIAIEFARESLCRGFPLDVEWDELDEIQDEIESL